VSRGSARGAEVVDLIQRRARSEAARTGTRAATSEYLVRHALESFLDRLCLTEHGGDFVLKGGILLAAYGIRRPTKDVDAEAISAEVSPEHLASIVDAIAAVDADDGVEFETKSAQVLRIRDEAEYPGLRMKVIAHVGRQKIVVTWDVSTGDPIVPAPRMIAVPRVLGKDIEMLGYAPETVIAEKGVTILERGITSTRWRDYVDIVELARKYRLDLPELDRSVRAVAAHRQAEVRPIGPDSDRYGAIGQAKWAAWRRKVGLERLSEALLDDQMALVAEVLDPIFGGIQRNP
jgi:hypothetical protein